MEYPDSYEENKKMFEQMSAFRKNCAEMKDQICMSTSAFNALITIMFIMALILIVYVLKISQIKH
jgi:hypothetical protein